MKRILLTTVLLAATGATTLAQNNRTFQRSPRAALEQPSNGILMPAELAEPYRQLLEVSIFARDRASGANVEKPRIVEPAPNTENFLTFRGVADDGERIIAFLEDTRDGSPVRVRIDDPLANGKVIDINADGLVYQRKASAEKFTVPLGSNLAGTEISPPPAPDRGFPAGEFPRTRAQQALGSAVDRAVRDSTARDGFSQRTGTRGNGRTGRTGASPSGRRRGGANGAGSGG